MRFIENKKLIASTRKKTNKLRIRFQTFAAGVAFCLFTLLAISTTAIAQDMAAVRRAIVQSSSNPVYFNIDTTGQMVEQNSLEITRLDDSGALVGFYRASGAPRPASTNVTGTITIVRAVVGATTGNAIRISFTVSTRTGTIPAVINTTAYEGAIKLLPASGSAFMAGTFSISGSGLSQTRSAPGPFPFCAMLKVPPIG